MGDYCATLGVNPDGSVAEKAEIVGAISSTGRIVGTPDVH